MAILQVWKAAAQKGPQSVRKNGVVKGRLRKHVAYQQHKPGPVTYLPAQGTPAIVQGFGPISQRSAVIYNK